MTAVQQFFQDLVHLGYIEYPDESLVQDRLNLALEMEKEQIIDAINSCTNGVSSHCQDFEEWFKNL
jgi:hypothetical protein